MYFIRILWHNQQKVAHDCRVEEKWHMVFEKSEHVTVHIMYRNFSRNTTALWRASEVCGKALMNKGASWTPGNAPHSNLSLTLISPHTDERLGCKKDCYQSQDLNSIENLCHDLKIAVHTRSLHPSGVSWSYYFCKEESAKIAVSRYTKLVAT